MSTTGTRMRIPFLDLRRQFDEVGAEAQAAAARVMAAGSYILGREVEAFETEWARFCGASGCAGVGNGTDALALALVASGAVREGRGDEVITTPLTAGYTALAILNAGGVPVFADIDPQTYTLDPDALARALTPRTRAIVPVHLYGRMADMEAIGDFAVRHGLIVVEDAAQAHGARLDGRPAGSFGQAAAFSFYPTKNLGAYGDGGAVVSTDAALVERVKSLREGGHAAALQGATAGRNSRLDEVQAAILRVKLARLEAWNERRTQLARIYDDALGRDARFQLPAPHPPGSHAQHLYVIRHDERDRLRAHLAERGVETLIHYPFLLHQQLLFRRSGQPALPHAEHAAPRIVSLPLYPQLRVEEAREVAESILSYKGDEVRVS